MRKEINFILCVEKWSGRKRKWWRVLEKEKRKLCACVSFVLAPCQVWKTILTMESACVLLFLLFFPFLCTCISRLLHVFCSFISLSSLL